MLDEHGSATLERLRALQATRTREAGAKPPADGYMLTADGMGGSPRRPKGARHGVGDAAQVAKMPHVHLSSLRHNATTKLIAAGTDVPRTSSRIRTPAIPLRVYAHRMSSVR